MLQPDPSRGHTVVHVGFNAAASCSASMSITTFPYTPISVINNKTKRIHSIKRIQQSGV
jgi:hypothetical protein